MTHETHALVQYCTAVSQHDTEKQGVAENGSEVVYSITEKQLLYSALCCVSMQ